MAALPPPLEAAPAVVLRDVVALAGRFPVLAGASCTVADGEVVAVLGGNGAGKTSLLRTIAGLVPVVAGQAEVLGVALRDGAAPPLGSVGLLGHHPGLFEELSAKANLAFVARIARVDRREVDAVLARVGLEGRVADTALETLSAGQRRRAGLAALLLRRPRLWLLDEPHASFDAAGRRLVDGLVAEAAGAGAAVLLTSHDAAEAASLADVVLTMRGGQVVERALGTRGRGGSDVA